MSCINENKKEKCITRRIRTMRSTNEWYGIIKDYATYNHKNLLAALNEIFQSDNEMTEEQFDKLEAIFQKEEIA